MGGPMTVDVRATPVRGMADRRLSQIEAIVRLCQASIEVSEATESGPPVVPVDDVLEILRRRS